VICRTSRSEHWVPEQLGSSLCLPDVCKGGKVLGGNCLRTFGCIFSPFILPRNVGLDDVNMANFVTHGVLKAMTMKKADFWFVHPDDGLYSNCMYYSREIFFLCNLLKYSYYR
jgi:hypothetical protein